MGTRTDPNASTLEPALIAKEARGFPPPPRDGLGFSLMNVLSSGVALSNSSTQM
jgi:hypothetical protein